MQKSALAPLSRKRRQFGALALAMTFSATAFWSAPATAIVDTELDTPYVQTPDSVVDAMLDLVQVGPGDTVIDLGAGDGRLLIEAARRGAKGFGVDIDPRLVEVANRNARQAGVADRARFLEQDLFETDLSSATVLTIYLLPGVNLKLLPTILALRPGTRLVSHDYGFGDWPPDQVITVEAPNKPVNAIKTSDLLYYVVPAPVAGTWSGQSSQGPWQLQLSQSFQHIEGTLQWGGREWPLQPAKLVGNTLEVQVGPDARQRLQLTFDANQVQGAYYQANDKTALEGLRLP